MVRFYDGRLGLLLERPDGDGAAPRLLRAGRVGAHFFLAVFEAGCGPRAVSYVREGCAAGAGSLRRARGAFLSPVKAQFYWPIEMLGRREGRYKFDGGSCGLDGAP